MSSQSKLDGHKKEGEIFAKYIEPTIKSKLGIDIGEWNTMEKISKLVKDMVNLLKLLRIKDWKSALNVMKGYSILLLPLLGWTLDYLIKQLPLGELTPLIAAKVQFIISVIGCGMWIGLAVFFAFQCKELYGIGSAILEVRSQLRDEKFKEDFDKIASNIEALKEIEKEFEELKKRYEGSDKLSELMDEAQEKMNQANEIYGETVEMINTLEQQLNRNKLELENSSRKSLVTSISGLAVAGVATAAFWWFPITGAVAYAAGIGPAIGGLCTGIWSDSLITEIKKHKSKLDDLKTDMEQVIERIKTLYDSFGQDFRDDPENAALFDEILNL